MYITITGSKNNKDVYITQSYRKENGKTSSRIFKKLGKYNELLSKFGGDKDALMVWAKNVILMLDTFSSNIFVMNFD
jgi:hypothetical protein